VDEESAMAMLQIKTRAGDDTVLDEEAIAELKSRLRGRLLEQHSRGYAEARAVWNGMIDRRPSLIARCTGAADVMACVDFARDHDARLAVRGGGHNVAGLAVCDGGLVVDLSEMCGIRVDPSRRTAWVSGGAKLGDLDHETQAFGLAAPVGVVSATGVAGLTLHGGFGWLSRRFGLSIDNLLGVDIVTADGVLRHASADENADLFWAVRGGGGNLGVVTSFELRLHPVGPRVWMLMALYPLDQAHEAMRVFRERMSDAPDELSAIAVFWSAPRLPQVPRKAWDAPVLIFLGCYSGPVENGERVLEPFRQTLAPLADLSAVIPFVEMQKALDADYPDGRLYYWKSLYLDTLDDEVLRAIAKHAAARPSPLSSLDVWGLGGEVNRIDPLSTAFGRRDAPFLLGIEANWERPEESDANMAWARGIYREMQRFSHGGSYLNFAGFAEEGDALVRGSYGGNYDRLQRVKSTYDPDNLFSGNLNVPPTVRK
jgi:FAD/FMN-containing dehydrogenase